MRPSRARSVRPIRGATRRRKAPVAPLSFGYSIQVACPATWCGIISSFPASLRLATIASPGAARRAGNGRPRADPPRSAYRSGREIGLPHRGRRRYRAADQQHRAKKQPCRFHSSLVSPFSIHHRLTQAIRYVNLSVCRSLISSKSRDVRIGQSCRRRWSPIPKSDVG